MTTFSSIGNDQGLGVGITIKPARGNQWEVYIPPTQPSHFYGYDPQWWGQASDQERHTFLMDMPILAPYGETYWLSFGEAMDFLMGCIAAGAVVANDGTVLGKV